MVRKWEDPDYRAKRAVVSQRRRGDSSKSRLGIPNGYTREAADHMWAQCHAASVADVEAIEAASPDAPWHPYARQALIEALAVMRSECNQRIKLQAARLFLEFTRPRPKSYRDASISTAEDWIAALIGKG